MYFFPVGAKKRKGTVEERILGEKLMNSNQEIRFDDCSCWGWNWDGKPRMPGYKSHTFPSKSVFSKLQIFHLTY